MIREGVWGDHETSESQTMNCKNLRLCHIYENRNLLSDTADVEGGNNEQFGHLDMTDTFFSYYNFSLEAMGVKAVNESP